MRCLSLLAAASALHVAIDRARATSFVVTSGQTVLTQQTLGPTDGETGTIEPGGSLGDGTPATPTTLVLIGGPNATLSNYGQLLASNQALATSGPNIGVLTIFNAAGATFSGSMRPHSGNVFVENHGLMTAPTSFTLLDFRDLSGSSLLNHADGVVMHPSGEPARLGANASVVNHGLITGTSTGIVTTNAASQSVTNYGTIVGTTGGARGVSINDGNITNAGTITGGRDGARAANSNGHLVLTNALVASIWGRSDSGVAASGTAAIVNHGMIVGGTAGVAGDDGIDVNGSATIDNYGTIIAVGSQDLPTGVDTNEGVTIGGGTLNNDAGASIHSWQNGVFFVVSADNNPNQIAPGYLSNAGAIIGETGYGVRFFGNATVSFNNTLINTGTIQGALAAVRMGSGDDQVTNSGTIVCGDGTAIDLGGGDDALTITAGSIQGDIDGGNGRNRISFDLASGQTYTHSHGLRNFEEIEVRRGRVKLDGTHAVVTNTLTLLDGAALDLTNCALVVDYDTSSPLASVRTRVASAYNSGAWDGDGITSSLADESNHGLGYAESDAIFTVFPATFAGMQVDDSAVLVRRTRYGDADLDGAVNLSDFNRLAANFGQTLKVWTEGDFNYDGLINLADFNLLAANFGVSAGPDGPDPDDWSSLAAAVPEPSALAAALLAPGLISRRRRRG